MGDVERRSRSMARSRSRTPSRSPSPGWPSGEQALRQALRTSVWADGQPVGRGHASPYIQAAYALAIARGAKTVEGRPGGGWVKDVAVNDYIKFKIPKQPRHSLAV